MNADNTVSSVPESHSLIHIGEHLYGFQITEAISLDEHTSMYLAQSVQSPYNSPQQKVVIRIANRSHHEQGRSLLEKEIQTYKHLYDNGGSRYVPYLIKTIQGDHQVLIREFMYGVPLQELFQFIPNGPMISEACILELGLRLADATWGLLQKGIPYFQIHPEHILITPEGRVILLSLGREAPVPLPYLPPEAMLSMPLDWRSNQWSIGMMMLALFLYNNDQDMQELEDFDFLSLHDSTLELNALLCSLIKNTQISEPVQLLLSEVLQSAVGNRFEKEDLFVQALLEAQTAILDPNRKHEFKGQLHSLQDLADFLWNNAPMLKSPTSYFSEKNTIVSEQNMTYGHLSSDTNARVFRSKRLQEELTKTPFSHTQDIEAEISAKTIATSDSNPLQLEKTAISNSTSDGINAFELHHEKQDEKQDQKQAQRQDQRQDQKQDQKQENSQTSSKSDMLPLSISEKDKDSHHRDVVLESEYVSDLSSEPDGSTQEIYEAGLHQNYEDGYLNTTELQFLITLDEVEQLQLLNSQILELPVGNSSSPMVDMSLEPLLNENKVIGYQQIIHYILPCLFLLAVLYLLFF